jgi:serine/threonine protein kinase/tetratricopeptide (TPR) repeat protein
MSNHQRVRELVVKIQVTGDPPEAVCQACPELLPQVLKRLQQVQVVEDELRKIIPEMPGDADAIEIQIARWKDLEKVMPNNISSKSISRGLPNTASLIEQHYEIVEKLGEGGMGIVYKARERETGRLVALKEMKQFDAAALSRFMDEFRALMSINHPNVVTLYDVISDGTQWFFTMELVEGRHFPGHLSRSSGGGSASITVDASSMVPEEPSPDDLTVSPEPPAALPGDLHELLRAFGQLADIIYAIHEHNKLHRDIKPSNVLVTPEKVVKVLDFGLVAQAVMNDDSFTHQPTGGTLAYMAPEQATNHAEKASDWYSFGLMLYETLNGAHPFRGTKYEMPWNRQGYVPPPLRTLVPGIPEDLSRLCDELLHFDPAQRPRGAEIRRRLEPDGPPPKPPPSPAPFLGRESHLDALRAAYADSRDNEHGRAVVVCLHGDPGVGKSALAAHFLGRLRKEHPNVVILRGRCFERATVPYKIGLVEALSRFWRHLPRPEAEKLLPTHGVGPLVQVFPVLERVEAVAEALGRGVKSPDPHEQRRLAFAALRDVLTRIVEVLGRPVVIHLDDLQWGDVDSVRMLSDLLMPEAPRLLLLASFRSEDRATSLFLRGFEAALCEAPLDRRELPVRPLSTEEARELASRLLEAGFDKSGADTAANADAVARESGGNPFFIDMLVQAVRESEAVVLDQVIWTRIGKLPEEQRRLLELVAVAGRPLHRSVAFRAAELHDGKKTLIDLQAAHLLRGGLAAQEAVETYHDRIRETVVARLAPEALSERHRRLAVAFQSSKDPPDPEVLAEHFHRSGQMERAGDYYAQAAEKAAKLLAFDRAANLYRMALEVRVVSAEETSRLQELRGRALANAGRGSDAAQAFLTAVAGAPPGQVLELQRQAGEQFMRAGHLDEGLEVLSTMLRRIGLSIPETHRRLLWAILWGRIKLWWRGTKFRERDASQVPADELARLNMCWSVSPMLSLADTFRAIALNFCHFYPLALNAGEPNQLARALSGLACCDAVDGGMKQERAENWLGQARELAERTGVPYTRATVESSTSSFALLLGQWKRSCECAERAENLYRTGCTGVAWEIGITCHHRFTALIMSGQWKQCAQELPPLVREARERGDVFTATSLQLHAAKLQLADDDPERARQTIQDAMRQWPQRRFTLQHHHALYNEAHSLLYAGLPDQALALIGKHWPALQESMLLRCQWVRIVHHHQRARCALAAAAASTGTRQVELLHSVERHVRQLERERMAWADPWAMLIRATMALRDGRQREKAVRLLESAVDGLERLDMLLDAAAARWQLGLLVGGVQGHALVQDGQAFMTNQGIRNPVRLLNALTPGFQMAPI